MSTEEKRRISGEIILWITAAVIFAAVMLVAWLSVPEIAPIGVVYTEPEQSAEATTTAVGSLCIDLNTATAEELMRLPGLGEKTAAAILAYRMSHNGFDSVEELLLIDGIGEKKLAAWKPYLTV